MTRKTEWGISNMEKVNKNNFKGKSFLSSAHLWGRESFSRAQSKMKWIVLSSRMSSHKVCDIYSWVIRANPGGGCTWINGDGQRHDLGIPCTDEVLQNCPSETCKILLTSITQINLIKNWVDKQIAVYYSLIYWNSAMQGIKKFLKALGFPES